MSNIATAAPAPEPNRRSLFYTTPELLDYYNKQVDQKFQPRGKDSENVNGFPVFVKPICISQKFSVNAPMVEVLTSVFDNGKEITNVYPYAVYYTVEKGYNVPPAPGAVDPTFVSMGTALWPAEKFCKEHETFEQ
jgi:hypothetical protein